LAAAVDHWEVEVQNAQPAAVVVDRCVAQVQGARPAVAVDRCVVVAQSDQARTVAVVVRCLAVDRCAALVQHASAVHVAAIALKAKVTHFCVLPARDAVTPRFAPDVPDAPRDLPAQVGDKVRSSPAVRPEIFLRLQESSPEYRKGLPAVHSIRAIEERLLDWASQRGHRDPQFYLHHGRREHRHLYEE
jgi:hypothetical protein